MATTTTIPITTMSATPAVTSALSSLDTSSSYNTLLLEIKNTIDKNDKLFQQIQQANYPNAGSYQSDLLNYKIDMQTKDLVKARQTVWDFITKKYNENTKLRAYYFDEIRKVEEHISQLNKQQQELIDSVQKKQLASTTANESILFKNYQFDKKHYYFNLFDLNHLTINLVLSYYLIL